MSWDWLKSPTSRCQRGSNLPPCSRCPSGRWWMRRRRLMTPTTSREDWPKTCEMTLALRQVSSMPTWAPGSISRSHVKLRCSHLLATSWANDREAASCLHAAFRKTVPTPLSS